MDRVRRRRVAIVAVAAVVAATCVALGIWQLRRLEDRRATNAAIVAARTRPPQMIHARDDVPPLEPYERAIASGAYDPEHEVLVFGRSLDGRPGHHVVTPLRLEGRGAILVLRGWVPFELDEAPVRPALPPVGAVTVRGTLLASEDGGEPPDARGVVARLDVEAIEGSLAYDVAPLVLRLDRQQPPRSELPIPVTPPPLSEGPHLSYAIQWFAFAAIAAAGGALLIRREDRASSVPRP